MSITRPTKHNKLAKSLANDRSGRLERYPDPHRNTDTLRQMAREAERKCAWSEAEAWWSLLLAESPRDAKAWIALSKTQFQRHDGDAATESLQTALRIEPSSSEAHLGLSIVHSDAGRPAMALDHAQQALAADPELHDARLARARAALALGDCSIAEQDLRQLDTLGHARGEAGVLEAKLHHAQGVTELALAVLADVIDAYPESRTALHEFRSIFKDFAAPEHRERFAEFCDGVGVTRPALCAQIVAEPPKASAGSIDVIVPVFNNLSDLEICLASVRIGSGALLGRIIIVDDGSNAAMRSWLSDQSADDARITVVRNDRPRGFTGAVMQGIEVSDAPTFVALNSDTEVAPGWLDALDAVRAADPSTMLVGPMSNGAAWQNTHAVFGATGSFVAQPLPVGITAQIMQRLLRDLNRLGPPTTPIVHGFCVLVDRAKYDAIGGLDGLSYQGGYGEFQDLSLRAAEAGFNARVATDCFVSHRRGGSIDTQARSERSVAARRRLYDMHGALAYLCAESLAIYNPFLEMIRETFQVSSRSDLFHPQPVRDTLRAGPVPDAVLKAERICVFVTHAVDGELKPHVARHLGALRKYGVSTVLVVNSDAAWLDAAPFRAHADRVILRANVGFDFGGWITALRQMPEILMASCVLFVNDSIFGPFGPRTTYDALLDRVFSSDADYVCAVETEARRPHFQSYFWALSGDALRGVAMRNYIARHADAPTLQACISRDELFLKDVLEKGGDLTGETLFPTEVIAPEMLDSPKAANPAMSFWEPLLSGGFPFLKVKVAQAIFSRKDNSHLKAVLSNLGEDATALQLELERLRLPLAAEERRLRFVARDTVRDSNAFSLKAHALTQTLPDVPTKGAALPAATVTIIIPVTSGGEITAPLRDTLNSLGSQTAHIAGALILADTADAQTAQAALSDEPLAKVLAVPTIAAGLIDAVTTVITDHVETEFVMILAPGDRLLPQALAGLTHVADANERAAAVYGDDIISNPAPPHRILRHRPDWSEEAFCGTDFIGHAVILRRSAVSAAGDFDPSARGAEMTDLLLRISERLGKGAIRRWPGLVLSCGPQTKGGHFPQIVAEHPPLARQAVVARHLSRKAQAPIRVVSAGFADGLRPIWPVNGCPLVSILIPTRDRLDLLRRTVEGVTTKTSYRNIEVLIVDNGSVAEETLDWFKEICAKDPRVRVLKMPGPFNFSDLNNRAARDARGDVLLFLNNDIEVIEPGWLDEMLGLVQRPGTGCVGAKLSFPDGILQHLGVCEDHRGIMSHIRYRAPRDAKGPFNRFRLRQEVQSVTGACLMIRRELFFEVGAFDDAAFRVNYNDIDLCYRVRQAGFSVIWTPFAHLLHHESATRGSDAEAANNPRLWVERMLMADRWHDRFPENPWDHPALETDYFSGTRLPQRKFGL